VYLYSFREDRLKGTKSPSFYAYRLKDISSIQDLVRYDPLQFTSVDWKDRKQVLRLYDNAKRIHYEFERTLSEMATDYY